MRNALILAALVAMTAPTFAADPAPLAPKGPACGKTAEECQKVVDAVNGQVQRQAATIAALIQQRDSIRSTADNAEVDAFVTKQAAAAAAAPKADTPKK